MIMSASVMVKRGHHAGGFVYGVFWADGANMVGAAVQAFHAPRAGESSQHVARLCPLDANFFAAFGAVG
jgi:predicted GNAT superfamily acetyltransferase